MINGRCLPNGFFSLLALLALSFALSGSGVADEVPSPRKVQVPGPLACGQIESILAEPAEYMIIDARSPSSLMKDMWNRLLISPTTAFPAMRTFCRRA